MVAGAVGVCRRDSRTSVGKYDKKAIRSRYAEGAYQITEVHT